MAALIMLDGFFTVSPCFDFLNHPIGVAGLSMKHHATGDVCDDLDLLRRRHSGMRLLAQARNP
jgi:hypothetical protein